MTTRRDFLKAGSAAVASGIVFCGCGLLHDAQAEVRRDLPVAVDGKRVRTIDVHAHCHFREAGALLGEEGTRLQISPVNGAAETYIDIGQRLAAMDAQAVDMEILSINPFWYNRDRELAAKIVKLQNESWLNSAVRIPSALPPSPRLPCRRPTLPSRSSRPR